MHLNKDCIRDLLLYFEEHLEANEIYQMNFNELDGYSKNDIYYTAIQLLDAKLIVGKSFIVKSKFPLISVKRISRQGHEFLDNIRPKTVWDKTKDICKELGTNSIDAIVKVSSAVITEIIKNKLGYI